MKQEQLTDYAGRWINEEHQIDLVINDDYTVLFYKLGDYRNILTSCLDYHHGNELLLVGDKILSDYSLTHENDELTLKQYHKGKPENERFTLIRLFRISDMSP